MKSLTLAVMLLLFTNFAWSSSQVDPRYFQLLQPQVEVIESLNEGPQIETHRELEACISEKPSEDLRSEFDLNQLINLGEKIWQIIKDGEPKLDFKSKSATAIPAQSQCLFYLTGWSIPQSTNFRVTYKNGFGMEVISMTYKLIYSYGGQFENRGRYLANVSVHPSQIQVSWGFQLDAQVHIQDILNIGSQADPEAGMQVALEWSVGSVMNKHKSQEVYFIQGSGPMTAL